MRELIKEITGWIHAVILLAVIIPVVYALGQERIPAIENTLIYRSLIIAVPVVLSGLAIKKCRTLGAFLMCSAGVFFVSVILAQLTNPFTDRNNMEFGYTFIIGAETLLVLTLRLADRMSRRKSENDSVEKTPYWKPEHNLLNKPSLTGIAVLALVYFFCRDFASKSVCDIALVSSIVYFTDMIIYKYIYKTDEYLHANRETKNVPSKRVYGIGNISIAVFVAAVLIAAIPAVLTIKNRQYRDYRVWAMQQDGDFDEFMSYIPENNADPVGEAVKELGDPTVMPPAVDMLIKLLGVAVFLFIAVKVIKLIIKNVAEFKETYDDNGDIVEELKPADTADEERLTKAGRLKNETQRDKVRRRYKEFIRKHTKVVPEASDTPAQIEAKAEITDKQECYLIHCEYEKYRYGK